MITITYFQCLHHFSFILKEKKKTNTPNISNYFPEVILNLHGATNAPLPLLLRALCWSAPSIIPAAVCVFRQI